MAISKAVPLKALVFNGFRGLNFAKSRIFVCEFFFAFFSVFLFEIIYFQNDI